MSARQFTSHYHGIWQYLFLKTRLVCCQELKTTFLWTIGYFIYKVEHYCFKEDRTSVQWCTTIKHYKICQELFPLNMLSKQDFFSNHATHTSHFHSLVDVILHTVAKKVFEHFKMSELICMKKNSKPSILYNQIILLFFLGKSENIWQAEWYIKTSQTYFSAIFCIESVPVLLFTVNDTWFGILYSMTFVHFKVSVLP